MQTQNQNWVVRVVSQFLLNMQNLATTTSVRAGRMELVEKLDISCMY